MYSIEFYEDARGKVEIADFLDELKVKGATSKTARVNRNKILAYMAVLAEKGVLIGEPVVKHIEEDIWELRPLRNRIFFFFWKDDTYVLLHHFLKKSRRTPKREIEQAKRNRDDWLERHDDEKGN